MNKRALAALAAVLFVAPCLAHAASAPSCEAEPVLDKYRLLRRLSLDLRGQVPSYEEYQALEKTKDVPVGTIRAFLKSDGFRQQMRAYHEALLWPNTTNVALDAINAKLVPDATFGAYWFSNFRRRDAHRGTPPVTPTALGPQCGDYEQTHFLPGSAFVPDPAFVQVSPEGYKQEGWRMVAPFWDPANPVKVCAYEAQETVSVVKTAPARTVSCNSPAGEYEQDCGCGPGLVYCDPQDQALPQRVIHPALREQIGLALDEVSVKGRPYTDLLLSTYAYENGPIAHWRRYLANSYSLGKTFNIKDPVEELADKPFSDPTFVKVERGPFHAGVTTLPGFLLRFQTNRGRANRTRIAFECEQFVPPEKSEVSGACSTTSEDLIQRCGCQYCHKTLEPLAAHFGQFTEAGSTLMQDLELFPRYKASCRNSGNAFCRRFYAAEADDERPGYLLAYQFANKHPEVASALAEGPRARSQQLIDSGAFARCTVRRVFASLMKRDIQFQGAQAAELPLFNELVTGFRADYDLPRLVERVVSLPQYKKVRP